MSSYNQEEKPWKKKAKRALLVIVIIAVVIGLLALAGSANNKAKQNMAKLNVPEYEIWYLPGGPQRFSDNFQDANSEGDKAKVKQDAYIWSTVLVKNDGLSEANNVSIQVDAALPLSQILVTPPGYGNEASIEFSEEDNTRATIDIESIGTEETTYIFVGFTPETIAQFNDHYQSESWLERYKSALNLIYIESVNTETTYYGHAATNLSSPKG